MYVATKGAAGNTFQFVKIEKNESSFFENYLMERPLFWPLVDFRKTDYGFRLQFKGNTFLEFRIQLNFFSYMDIFAERPKITTWITPKIWKKLLFP